MEIGLSGVYVLTKVFFGPILADPHRMGEDRLPGDGEIFPITAKTVSVREIGGVSAVRDYPLIYIWKARWKRDNRRFGDPRSPERWSVVHPCCGSRPLLRWYRGHKGSGHGFRNRPGFL